MNDNDFHDDDDYEDDFATGKGNQCQSLVRWQQMSPFKGQDDDHVHYDQPIMIIGYDNDNCDIDNGNNVEDIHHDHYGIAVSLF